MQSTPENKIKPRPHLFRSLSLTSIRHNREEQTITTSTEFVQLAIKFQILYILIKYLGGIV